MAQELTQGGSERQLAEIARSLDRREFAPHVAVFRPGGIRFEELVAAGIPITIISVKSFGSPRILGAAWKFGQYLRRHRVRLVHSFDVPASVFAPFVARAIGTPVVLSSQRAFRGLAPRHLRPVLRLSDRVVDGIVVNCHALEKHLIDEYAVPASKIQLCYNGVDTLAFSPRAVARPSQLSDASLVVGVVCALRPEKDLLTLLKAFAIALSRESGLLLVVVGSGPVLPQLEQLRDALHLRNRCLFVPSATSVVDWLRAFDIFVLPSRTEALSNSLMEAMACGCAVIASDVGGNPELVEHGQRGLLFQPGDAEGLANMLLRLSADPQNRSRMAAAAREFIESRLTLPIAAARMGEIYRDFLSRKS